MYAHIDTDTLKDFRKVIVPGKFLHGKVFSPEAVKALFEYLKIREGEIGLKLCIDAHSVYTAWTEFDSLDIAVASMKITSKDVDEGLYAIIPVGQTGRVLCQSRVINKYIEALLKGD